MDRDELDLTPYIRATRRNPWVVLFWIVLCGGIAALITWRLKPSWRADAVLLMPLDSGSSNPLSALVKGDTDPLEILKGILESRATLDYLHERTGIDDRDLEKMMSITTKKDANQLTISATDKNDKLSLKVVTDAVTGLQTIAIRENVSQAGRQLHEIESTLAEKNADLKKAEDGLLHSVQTNKTAVDPSNPFQADYIQKKKEAEYELQKNERQIDVALSEARKMGVQGLSLPTAIPGQEALRQQLVRQQYELDTKLTQLGAGNPDVRSLQAQIQVTKNLIKTEVAKYLKAADQRIDPTLAQLEGDHILLLWQNDYLDGLAKAAPVEALNAARLLREVTMQQDALKYIREKYEETKLQGTLDPMRWTVLVPPYVEERPTNKRYGAYSAIGCAFGLLFGIIAAARREGKRQRKALAKGVSGTDDGGSRRAVTEQQEVGVGIEH